MVPILLGAQVEADRALLGGLAAVTAIPRTAALSTASAGPVATVSEVVGAVSPLTSVLITVYLVMRLLIPPILIVYTFRDASPRQRIELLQTYLVTGHSPRLPVQ